MRERERGRKGTKTEGRWTGGDAMRCLSANESNGWGYGKEGDEWK